MNQPAPKPKDITASSNLRLSAPCPSARGKWSKLSFSQWMGNPRIEVMTEDPNDQGNNRGRITAKMDLITFQMILNLVRTLCTNPEETKWKIELKKPGKFQQGQPPAEAIHEASVIVGRDAEGVIFISVKDELISGRPVVKFPFAMTNRFTRLVRSNGEPPTASELSIQAARAWCDASEKIMAQVCVDRYEHPQPPGGGYNRNGGGGGGGNWNRNQNNGGGNGGGNSGGGAPSSGGGDDDFPF